MEIQTTPLTQISVISADYIFSGPLVHWAHSESV